MKLRILVLGCCLGLFDLASALSAQNTQSAAIDAYLAAYLKQTGAPGISVVVVKAGQVVFQKGYGVEVIGKPAPMTVHSVSAIGSLTKSFTALAILQLVDRGLVRLDDPVVKYLPWFHTAEKNKSDRITLRMLLGMRSGLVSMDAWANVITTDDAAIEAGVRSLASAPLNGEPGNSYEYANESFNVLGLIISRVTNMPYREYIAQNILAPLDMKRSSTDIAVLENLGELTGHDTLVEGFAPAARIYASSSMPGGSVFASCASDLGHYVTMLLAGGLYKGQRLVSAESFALLIQPQISFPGLSTDMGGTGQDDSYAMGWMRTSLEGHNLVEHGGSVMTMSSMTTWDPERQVGVSILFNFNATLDSWRFTTAGFLAYNVLRLACGEGLSVYGTPKIKNPYLAEPFVDIPAVTSDRLIGSYISDKEFKAEIRRTAKGLVVSYAPLVGKYHLVLNFYNEGRGVGSSPNFFQPFSISWNSDHSIRYLDLGPARLFPLRQNLPDGFSLQDMQGQPVKLALPKAWTMNQAGGILTARSDTAQLVVSLLATNTSTPQSTLLPTEAVSANGQVTTEAMMGHTFTQQMFRLQDGRRLAIILSPRATGTLVFHLVMPEASATTITQTVLGTLLKYSQW